MKIVNKNGVEQDPKDIDRLFGTRITQNRKWVVRFKRTMSDSLNFKFHEINQDGNEVIPLTWVLGISAINKKDE